MKTKKMLSSRQAALFLGGLCSLAYFASYFTRYTLTVCISEITGLGLLSIKEVGVATMLLFICYGAGQVLSGILGDKFPSQYIVLIGLFGGVISNLLLPLIITKPTAVAILWGFNGICQSMFWPPLVKIMAFRLPTRYYTGSTLAVSIAAHLANVSLYLITSFVIGQFNNWKLVFHISCIFAVITIFLWILGFRFFSNHYVNEEPQPEISSQSKKGDTDYKGLTRAVLTSGALVLLIGIILQGMIKEGVTAWLPNFITQSYPGATTADTIFKSVSIPIASIVCLLAVDFVYRRFLKNEALGAAVMFGVGTLMALIMMIVPNMPAMVKIILAAILTASMHGVNLFLIAYLPGRFKRFGSTGTVSGVTNACAYIGCAAYSYGFAAIANDNFSIAVMSWLIIPAIGLVACAVAIPFWSKFIKQK